MEVIKIDKKKNRCINYYIFVLIFNCLNDARLSTAILFLNCIY